jgi:uncharacterized protein YbjT (DUF2867 family)
MARILIVGGGARGRGLACALTEQGHAVRILTRTEQGREAIERAGAECWIGDPDRLGTLIGALSGVTIACWLLGCASGPDQQVAELHDLRLRSFMVKAIDTTIKGVLYEAAGSVRAPVLQRGAEIARDVAGQNRIPLAVLDVDPAQAQPWRAQATAEIERMLAPETATEPRYPQL